MKKDYKLTVSNSSFSKILRYDLYDVYGYVLLALSGIVK